MLKSKTLRTSWIPAVVVVILVGCSPDPKNEFSLRQIADNYGEFLGKSVTLQVSAVAPSSYFNYSFAGRQDAYWSVEVSDGTLNVYAYFSHEKFSSYRFAIASFHNTKLTITATVAATISGAGFPNSLLEVTGFSYGWN